MLANMYDIAEYIVLPVILISGDQNESALNTAKGNGNHKTTADIYRSGNAFYQ